MSSEPGEDLPTQPDDDKEDLPDAGGSVQRPSDEDEEYDDDAAADCDASLPGDDPTEF